MKKAMVLVLVLVLAASVTLAANVDVYHDDPPAAPSGEPLGVRSQWSALDIEGPWPWKLGRRVLPTASTVTRECMDAECTQAWNATGNEGPCFAGTVICFLDYCMASCDCPGVQTQYEDCL